MNSKCPTGWHFTKSEYTRVAGTEIKKQKISSIPEALVRLCVQPLSLNLLIAALVFHCMALPLAAEAGTGTPGLPRQP